jgi:hypothetical protein
MAGRTFSHGSAGERRDMGLNMTEHEKLMRREGDVHQNLDTLRRPSPLQNPVHHPNTVRHLVQYRHNETREHQQLRPQCVAPSVSTKVAEGEDENDSGKD